MPFYTYMLHCADRSFYVGHTDDLQTRVAQHEAGGIASYTQIRRPVKLVWSQEFSTRIEAIEAERQIKGWSRAKKLALIREDWDLISILAHSNKDK
ncbi:GIY-YIG nuclease family protein [Sphingobium sp. Cam5-1]|uniref:GIY-YIG nuclease family protein n=1 Tax=Sphingobium sp. Cam5-1 TaxID=2789327 RepID=UPI0018AD1E26|nr:GIY-YIG nuclease family protein [Sphingobium sp. Cam5-1]QPI73816.1 GIY-YIG nuclease family protein [Sphingobium sp. Cam5-1]